SRSPSPPPAPLGQEVGSIGNHQTSPVNRGWFGAGWTSERYKAPRLGRLQAQTMVEAVSGGQRRRGGKGKGALGLPCRRTSRLCCGVRFLGTSSAANQPIGRGMEVPFGTRHFPGGAFEAGRAPAL